MNQSDGKMLFIETFMEEKCNFQEPNTSSYRAAVLVLHHVARYD
jgi:hypothetical protein